jgi:hypothetical protein
MGKAFAAKVRDNILADKEECRVSRGGLNTSGFQVGRGPEGETGMIGFLPTLEMKAQLIAMFRRTRRRVNHTGLEMERRLYSMH